jgi:hypothetical protein
MFGQVHLNNYEITINDFLKQIRGKIYPHVSWYSETQLDSLMSFSGGMLKTETSEWSCTLIASHLTEPDALDVKARFRMEKGGATSATVS